MKKSISIILIIVVLALFIGYFIYTSNCKKESKCSVELDNIPCTSHTDCYSGSTQGFCNLKTFKCENMFFKGDEEECLKVNGTWNEGGC
jgi:hypothetical protein